MSQIANWLNPGKKTTVKVYKGSCYTQRPGNKKWYLLCPGSVT